MGDVNRPSGNDSERAIDSVDRPWSPGEEASVCGPDHLSPASSPLGVVLVFEDDPRIVMALQQLFRNEGFEFRKSPHRRREHNAISSPPHDSISVHLQISEISSEICASLKQNPQDIPMLFLAAVFDVAERDFLMKAAQDGYLTKQFDQRELLVQLQDAFRRLRRPMRDLPVAFGHICLDFAKMRARKNGQPVALTALQFKLIRFFLDNPDRVITREELLSSVWEHDASWSTRSVDNQILKLRQALEDDPANPVYFCTVHGVGYRFVPTAEMQ